MNMSITFTIGLGATRTDRGSCLQEGADRQMTGQAAGHQWTGTQFKSVQKMMMMARGMRGTLAIQTDRQANGKYISPTLLTLHQIKRLFHGITLYLSGDWTKNVSVINSIQFLLPIHFNSLINLLIVLSWSAPKNPIQFAVLIPLPLFLGYTSTHNSSKGAGASLLNQKRIISILLLFRWQMACAD